MQITEARPLDAFRGRPTATVSAWRVESLFFRAAAARDVDPEGELVGEALAESEALASAAALGDAWAGARQVSAWSTEAEALDAARAELAREVARMRAELGDAADALEVDETGLRADFRVAPDAAPLWWLRLRVRPCDVTVRVAD